MPTEASGRRSPDLPETPDRRSSFAGPDPVFVEKAAGLASSVNRL